MKSKLVLLSSLFFSLTAQAVSLEFKFDINSSGPSIYACNAGIKHKGYRDRVCYDRVTGNSCKPAEDCRSEVDCNCVCTGSTAPDGETRHDFLRVSYDHWKDNGETAGYGGSKNLYAPETHYNTAFNENHKEEWHKQLTKMTVNLGSERYGAEFFLDVCYRGPQIEYFAASQHGGFPPPGIGTPNFSLKAQATINDIVSQNGLKYSHLADLKVKTEVVCDQQGKGDYKYAGTHHPYGPTQYDLVKTDIHGMWVGDGQFHAATNFRDFNNYHSAYLLNQFINVNNAFTPRFCKVRYTFLENRRYDHNPLKQLRKWKLQKAQVCTFTEINEDQQL